MSDSSLPRRVHFNVDRPEATNSVPYLEHSTATRHSVPGTQIENPDRSPLIQAQPDSIQPAMAQNHQPPPSARTSSGNDTRPLFSTAQKGNRSANNLTSEDVMTSSPEMLPTDNKALSTAFSKPAEEGYSSRPYSLASEPSYYGEEKHISFGMVPQGVATPEAPAPAHWSGREAAEASEETLYDPRSSSAELRSFGVKAPPAIRRRDPPDSIESEEGSSNTLRSALRASTGDNNMIRSVDLLRGKGSSRLEEGGRPAEKGVFANMLKLYGLTSRRNRNQSETGGVANDLQSRTTSIDSSRFHGTSADFGESRAVSMNEGEMLDPDDPRITGAEPNKIDDEKHARNTFTSHAGLNRYKKRQASIKYHISCTPFPLHLQL